MTEHSIEPDDRGLVLACPKCGQRNRMVYARLGHKFHCAQCHTELSSPSQPIEVLCSKLSPVSLRCRYWWMFGRHGADRAKWSRPKWLKSPVRGRALARGEGEHRRVARLSATVAN
jgi:predicted RNA-binding Zn-ribbon protein involved in translation (DUF1610 family)